MLRPGSVYLLQLCSMAKPGFVQQQLGRDRDTHCPDLLWEGLQSKCTLLGSFAKDATAGCTLAVTIAMHCKDMSCRIEAAFGAEC